MANPKQLETILEGQLRLRGLPRAPGALAFAHDGDVVRVSLGESVYRGLVVTVHAGADGPRQFRAVEGTYDWDAIADCIVETAERRRAERGGRSRSASRSAHSAPFTIAPSASPGRMRVNLANMDLEPAAAMQLYALLRQAGAVA
jgi:hypothetical protein